MDDDVAEAVARPRARPLAAGDPTARGASRTALLSGGRILAAAVSMAWMVVVARTLDEDQVGSLSLGLNLFAALSVLADLGLPMIVADRVARRSTEARPLLRRVVRVRVAASLLVGVAIVALYRAGSDDTLAVPLFMAVAMVATAVHSSVTAALRGLGHVLPDAVNEVASRLLVLGLGWWLLAGGHGLAAAAAVFAVADVASALALTRWARRAYPDEVTVVPPGLLSARAVVPLAAALLVGSLHTRIDVWLLAVLGGTEVVAHYAVPARVAEGLLLPALVGASLVLPLTSGETDLGRRGRRALSYVGGIVALVAVLAAVAAAVAAPVLRIAFGAAYEGDADVLRVLALAAVPGAASVALAPVLAIHARRTLVRWVVAALVANVALNLLLVPHLEEMGAAWASAASVGLVAGGSVATVLRWPVGAVAVGEEGP